MISKFHSTVAKMSDTEMPDTAKPGPQKGKGGNQQNAKEQAQRQEDAKNSILTQVG